MVRTHTFFITLIVLITVSVASAHPPSDVELFYDLEVEELTVIISHSSGSPDAHYVNRVEISINGALVLTEEPAAENDPIVTIDLAAFELDEGDIISVRAFCNRAGDLVKQVVVGE